MPRQSFKIAHLFLSPSKTVAIAIALLVAQQAIVASSTVWISRVIQGITHGQEFYTFLCLYLCSLLLPYVPGGLALIFIGKWKQQVFENFLTHYIHTHSGRAELWGDKTEKSRRNSIVSGEAYSVIQTAIDQIYMLVSVSLNVALNILTLAFFIDARFVTAFSLSTICAYLLLQKINRRQKSKASEHQAARVQLNEILLRNWDNVLLKNPLNYKTWHVYFQSAFQAHEKKFIHLLKFQQLASISVALITFIPAITVVLLGVRENTGNTAILGTFVVTLPRLFATLNFTHELLSSWLRLGDTKQKLEGISSILEKAEEAGQLARRISWEKIRISISSSKNNAEWSQITPKSIEQLKAHLRSPCRIRVSGPNGSGKSSLLLQLKEELKSEAIYLPVLHDLSFSKLDPGLSTGQKMKRDLNEILESSLDEILLLDEWNANLDQETAKEISQLLQQASTLRPVLEITHQAV